jgi:hypothetical protein
MGPVLVVVMEMVVGRRRLLLVGSVLVVVMEMVVGRRRLLLVGSAKSHMSLWGRSRR